MRVNANGAGLVCAPTTPVPEDAMEQWSASEEQRYWRPERSLYHLIVAVLAVIAAGSAFYYYSHLEPDWPERVRPAAVTSTEEAAAPQAPAQQGAARNRLPAPDAAGPALPTLENSDSMARESLAGLLGRKAFDDFVLPAQLVRRIVATVDNLPRQTAPRRMVPLAPVPGALATASGGEETTLDPANAARYAPYVRVFEALEPRDLVRRYVQAYPLFQRAYEELGFPGRYFNDRLLETIDDLLAAPEIGAPVRLLRPKVVFEFSDPALETRSAGQKIMIRMGVDNAQRVKAKLREIRQALVAAAARRP
jgi:hypothetical protein